MTHTEFIQLVKDMRIAQKSYFKARREGTRSDLHLTHSKELEKQVDQAIVKLTAPPPPPSLFDTTEPITTALDELVIDAGDNGIRIRRHDWEDREADVHQPKGGAK